MIILYVAFVRKLVFWICSKQKIIMKYLGDYFKNSDFNISGVKEQENYIGFRRVYHHYRMLKATGFLVRLFFSEMEESSELKNYLDKSIEHCVKDTLKELTVGPKNSDILEAFLRSFKKKKLIARNPNKYFSDEDERIFFLHENCLYFKGEALARYISNVLKKYVSVITLSKELNEVNLLVHF